MVLQPLPTSHTGYPAACPPNPPPPCYCRYRTQVMQVPGCNGSAKAPFDCPLTDLLALLTPLANLTAYDTACGTTFYNNTVTDYDYA